MLCSYMLEEARLVSSCFSFPSSARPRLSWLFFSKGYRVYTFFRLVPDCTVSLWQHQYMSLSDVMNILGSVQMPVCVCVSYVVASQATDLVYLSLE